MRGKQRNFVLLCLDLLSFIVRILKILATSFKCGVNRLCRQKSCANLVSYKECFSICVLIQVTFSVREFDHANNPFS